MARKKSAKSDPRTDQAKKASSTDQATGDDRVALVDDAEHALEGAENVFVRDYTILAEQWDEDVEKYANDVRQHCINRGLRPTGEVRFVKSVKQPDGVSLDLIFEVDATTAPEAEQSGANYAATESGHMDLDPATEK